MTEKSIFNPFELHLSRGTVSFHHPVVMGILNATPDSFFDGGRYTSDDLILQRAETLALEGADIIDIGVVSSRPGAQLLAPEVEAPRLAHVVSLVRSRLPQAIISVDTCYSLPAKAAVQAGADIVNDISGGQFDSLMFPTVASLHVPYILMHTVGTPDHMQDQPHYLDVTREVGDYFQQRLAQLDVLGVRDVIIDPGFGFAKTLDHNYQLFNGLAQLHRRFPHRPLLVALSRKSMIYRLLGTTPDDALPGTIALNALSLQAGAQLIRVHDVRPAVQSVRIWQHLQSNL